MLQEHLRYPVQGTCRIVIWRCAKIGIFAKDPWGTRSGHMSNDEPFRNINELVAALLAASRELGDGSLELDGLETACTDARELYERLVVLRHKARESVSAPGQGGGNKLRERDSQSRAQEPAPVRLDTRPATDTSSRQTSLIDAIASTEQGDKKPVRKETGAQTPSLAEKLEKAAVEDLNKAISLSHKFWFVAELFNGDRAAYDKGVEQLNNFKDMSEARDFLEKEVVGKLKVPADPEALATFTDLVQRRYA